VPIYIDGTGVETLDLVVTADGDGKGWDHADWADARPSCDA
jgi:alpha-glucosidase